MREKKTIRANTVFVLKPGEWHRYRPTIRSGWTEDWIELRGHLVDYWLANGLFEHRFFELPSAPRFFTHFDAMHEAVRTTGHMPEGALESYACQLVAELGIGRSLQGTKKLQSCEREQIAQARQMLTEGIEIQSVADQLRLPYQALYRRFKKITGLSPKEFAERGRMARAEAMLAGDKLSIKEIAHELGYYSASHFSLAFKRFYEQSPTTWRENLMR